MNQWGFTGLTNMSLRERLLSRSSDYTKWNNKSIWTTRKPHPPMWVKLGKGCKPGAICTACRQLSHPISLCSSAGRPFPHRLFTSVWHCWKGALRNLLSFCSPWHVTLCLPPVAEEALLPSLSLQGLFQLRTYNSWRGKRKKSSIVLDISSVEQCLKYTD